jgi:hypothetical protein
MAAGSRLARRKNNMSDEKKPLNLDELFGQARAVKVIWKGQTYELMHLNSMSPKQYVMFSKLQKKTTKLQSLGEDVTDEQAKQVVGILDEMLHLVCGELPLSEFSFIEKTKVLMFYIEETQGKKATDLALTKVKSPTGARSSAK